jgi:hypothetical protein
VGRSVADHYPFFMAFHCLPAETGTQVKIGRAVSLINRRENHPSRLTAPTQRRDLSGSVD